MKQTSLSVFHKISYILIWREDIQDEIQCLHYAYNNMLSNLHLFPSGLRDCMNALMFL